MTVSGLTTDEVAALRPGTRVKLVRTETLRRKLGNYRVYGLSGNFLLMTDGSGWHLQFPLGVDDGCIWELGRSANG